MHGSFFFFQGTQTKLVSLVLKQALHTFLFKYACFLWHELDYINISFFSALTQKNTLYDLDNLGATSNFRWDQFHVRV